MTLHDFLFWLIGGLTGLSAITMVLTQNIVRAAVWLLFTLAGTSALFFLLGADFIGATQLLIYVGGTLVLVVFGVMLTAQGPFITMKSGAGEWAIAMVVGISLFGLLSTTILLTPWGFQDPKPTGIPEIDQPRVARSSNDLGGALLGITDFTPEAELPAKPTAPRKQTSYLLPFEIVSVHLLVVLLGAAYLARAKRRRGARTS